MKTDLRFAGWRLPMLVAAAVALGLALILLLVPMTPGSGESGVSAAAGLRVTATPGPAARNASIWSEISFRGVNAKRAGRITVRGSRSGRHGYTIRRHGEKRGFSLLLKRRLAPSERVSVRTRLHVYGARAGGYRFRTGNLVSARSPRQRAVARPQTGQPGFVTRPGLTPSRMQITRRSGDASDQPLFVGAKGGGATIYGADGEPIWTRPGRITDFRPGRLNGRPVLTWFEAPTRGSGLKRNTYMIADRSYRIVRRVTPGNGLSADSHEFRLTGRGTAYVTGYRAQKRNLARFGLSRNGRVLDSIAQEVEIKTGRVIWEWHSLDHVPVAETYAKGPKRSTGPFDYFHINTVADTPDGNVLISGRNTGTAYKVNRRTGRVIWRLGGRRSNFRLGGKARFSWQHDTEPLGGNRLSVFDNATSPVAARPSRRQSRGLILKLDRKRKTARAAHVFLNPGRPLASTQGNVQRLDNGNYLVGWGGRPLVSEHSPDGKLVFDARMTGLRSFYRAYRGTWRGRPQGRPAVAAKRLDSGDRTRLWISHNGDTETVTWRISTGPDRKRLSPLTEQARDGFETTVSVRGIGRFVKIRGYDRQGKPVGKAAIVSVS